MRLWWLAGLAGLACNGKDSVTLGDDDDETADCVGAEPFVAGTEQMTTGGLFVSISTALPTPPDVGDNAWTISVRTESGPVEGLSLKVTPWMPLHGHGLVPPDYGASDLGGGLYQVDSFDLIMPGLWEFTVDCAGDSEQPDTTVLSLCAEG